MDNMTISNIDAANLMLHWCDSQGSVSSGGFEWPTDSFNFVSSRNKHLKEGDNFIEFTRNYAILLKTQRADQNSDYEIRTMPAPQT